MADRIGYPTSDITSLRITEVPGGGSLFSHVDDDGNAADYLNFFATELGGLVTLGFSDFGAMPTSDAVIELYVWALWNGGTPNTTTLRIYEGGTLRNSTSFTPTASNTAYLLQTTASSFTSVAALRGEVQTGPSGGATGELWVTGMKIIMPGAAFAHLDWVSGLPQVVPAGQAGEMSFVSGLPVRSSHGERYGSSLIEVAGLWQVQSA